MDDPPLNKRTLTNSLNIRKHHEESLIRFSAPKARKTGVKNTEKINQFFDV